MLSAGRVRKIWSIHMRSKLAIASVLGASLLLAGVAPAAMAANNSRQAGLVNVSTGDVDLLNNVNIGIAANVIATVCDVTVPVAVLATQIVGDGSATYCAGTAAPITIAQSQPGDGTGTPSAGGNNSGQAGLVNVSLGDVSILNNLNLALAANVLVTACDLTVPVAILAVQAVGDAGATVCTTSAGPINLSQTQ
jgi:hypothetical protein